MALKMRLQRFGSRNKPFYQVVVTDSRSPRNGRFIERLGYYNPMTEPSTVELYADRVTHWYKVGARPTNQVANLIRIQKIDVTAG